MAFCIRGVRLGFAADEIWEMTQDDKNHTYKGTAIKTLRIACMELSPRCGGSSLCMEEWQVTFRAILPDRKDFCKTAKEQCISEMPRNITLRLFRQPFLSASLHEK